MSWKGDRAVPPVLSKKESGVVGATPALSLGYPMSHMEVVWGYTLVWGSPVLSGGRLGPPPTIMGRQTPVTCENITFHRTTYAGGIYIQQRIQKLGKKGSGPLGVLWIYY